MANNIIKRVWNQNRMVNIEDLSGMAFQAEDGGHTFVIRGIDDTGADVALSGTVAGVFRRPDNADIALTGSTSDGVASVTLTDDCYAVPGRFGLTIFVTADSQKTAVYACVGTVASTSGGEVAGDTPQDVVDLINAINAAVATIPADYTTVMAAMAPTYSSSAVYPAGYFVWYDGSFYKSKVAITTAESFDSTKWEASSIGPNLAGKIDKNEKIFTLASFDVGDEYNASTNPTGWDDQNYWSSTGPHSNSHFRTTGIIENKEKLDLYLHHTVPAPTYAMYVTGYDMTDPSNPTYINGSYLFLQGSDDSEVNVLPYAESRRFFRVSFYYKSSSFREDAFYIQYTETPTEVYDIEKPITIDDVYGFYEAARQPILDAENRISTVENESVIGITYLDDAVKSAFDRLQDYVGSDKTALIGQATDIHGYIDKLAQMSKINELFEFDAIIHGGDIALGPFTPALTQEEMRGLMLQSKRRMNCTAPWLFTNGNHDGPVYNLNGSDVGQIFNGALARRGVDVTFGDNESYGYIDLKNDSMRLIFLNTSEKTATSSGYRISSTQYAFLISALSSVPSGYNVVITSHVTPDFTITHMNLWNGGDVESWLYYPYVKICNDFNAHKSGSVTVGGVAMTYDFSALTARIVCVISGHEHFNANHVLRVTNDPGSNVMYIVRQGYGSNTTDSGSHTNVTCPSGYVAIFDRFEKSGNSLFDIFCVKSDYTAKVIRIGVGGADRDLSFNWGPAT